MAAVIVRFTVPGVPATQGSMSLRYVKGKRFPVMRHPPKTVQWRNLAKLAAAHAMRGRQMFSGPAAVRVVYVLPRPPSLPKRVLWPQRKPDLDKLARALGDAMSKLVLYDDSAIVSWRADKVFGDPPRTEVSVFAAVEGDLKAIHDELTGGGDAG